MNKTGKGRFVAGDSRINRKGRPKKGESISDMTRDALLEVIDPASGYRRIDSIIDRMVTQAQQGNKDARKELLDRVYGKVPEKVENLNTDVVDLSKLSDEDLERLLIMQEKLKDA